MINGRFSLIPAIYVVFRREDEVLLLRRFQTGYMDGFYSLPAGHVDGGEPAIEAAAREAKEEIGIDLKPRDLQFAHVMHRVAKEGDHERMDLYFEAKKWAGEPQNVEPHKCDELRWAKLDNLPENMVPEVRLALQKILAAKPYSDFNFPTRVM